MKFSNLIKKLWLLVLMLIVSFCFYGCNQENPNDEEDPEQGEENEEGESGGEKTLEEKCGLSIKVPSNRPLKIAQFADLHFGVEGKDWHNDKEARTIAYMDYIVETAKPDLIVCSGDNILTTGINGLKEFVEKMDSYKIPWTFIYGNHDAESSSKNYKKADLSKYLDECDSDYLLYESGYVEATSENRYGNYTVSVLDSEGKTLLGGIILMDSGTYDYDKKDYQAITEGQIDWYISEIERLQNLYGKEEVVPTIVFSHIQLPEFQDAYHKAAKKEGAEFIIEQTIISEDGSIGEGGPQVNTGLYDVLVEKKSTKAYLVGHAHTNFFQVKMDGIILGFAPQVGFAKLFDDNDLGRNCYVYHLNNDFTFTTTNCKEVTDKVGLSYSGTYEGNVKEPNEKGEYVVEATFVLWNRLMFSYNGVRLTPENTNITGYFKNVTEATWSEYLYSSDGKKLIYSSSKENTYIFTYNPTTNTLNVDLKIIEVEVNLDEIKVDSVNKDSGADSITLWTEAGTYFRNLSEFAKEWRNDGWRYYIIVDSEGRICYAVSLPPNGYGGPMGTGYYCNSFYSDYLQNPALEILEGYGPWTKENPGPSKLYQVKIPEGGFAFTAHGSGIGEIVAALSNGTIDNTSEANINKRGVYSDDIRLSYDATNKVINITRGN